MTHICFSKKGPETPIFIVFLGARFFGPGCQEREILDTHPTKKKNSLITEKRILSFFLFFLFFFSFFLFLFFWVFFCVFFGGFKGHVRWPEGPPHLAPNPPCFFFLFLFCFFCFFLEGLRVR